MNIEVIFLLISTSVLQTVNGLEGRLFVITFINTSTSATTIEEEGFREVLVNSFEDTLFRVETQSPWSSGVYVLDASNERSQNFSYVHDPKVPDEQAPNGTAAILVHSEKKISISASQSQAGTTGAYLALPVTKNAKEFFIPSWPGFGRTHSAFSVISLAGDACAELYRVNGNKFERVDFLHLTKLEVKHFMDKSGDYTGYYINATRPLSVLAGHECAFVPDATVNYCDHIVEQVPPLVEWGNKFLMVSPVGRNFKAGYFVRVIGGYDNTEVKIKATDGTDETHRIDKGMYLQSQIGYQVPNVVVASVECSKNCLVTQYNPGFTYANETEETDPFMVIIPPITHWPKDAKFGTNRYFRRMLHAGVEGSNFITLIAKDTCLSTIRINGQALSWVNIGNYFSESFSFRTRPISQGFYEITADGQCQFAVFVTGHGAVSDEHTAWSYLGGYLITDDDYDGPWYNVTQYDLDNDPTNPTIPESGPGGLGLGPGLGDGVDYTLDIPQQDLPYYELVWKTHYVTKKRNGKITSRKCSEGYGRQVYAQMELAEDTLEEFLATYCGQNAAGMTITMNNLGYYSEYSRGDVTMSFLLQGTVEHSLADVINCANNLKKNIDKFHKWSGQANVLGDERLIEPDAKFGTQDCDPVFLHPDVFQSAKSGWLCSERVSVISFSFSTAVEPCAVQTWVIILANFLTVKMLWN